VKEHRYIRAEKRAGKGVAVEAMKSNVITFKNRSDVADPFPANTVYSISAIRCYDADGNNIDYKITAQDIDDFTIFPVEDGFLDYLCTEIYQTIPE
jgi:hypothetical protein